MNEEQKHEEQIDEQQQNVIIIKEENKKGWTSYIIDGITIALLILLIVGLVSNFIWLVKNSSDEDRFTFPNANGEIIPYGSFENEDTSVPLVFSDRPAVVAEIRYNVNINTCSDSTISYAFRIVQNGGRGSSDYYMVKDEAIKNGNYLRFSVSELVSDGDAIKLQQEEDGANNTFVGTRAEGEITIATMLQIKMGNLPDTKPFISFDVPEEWLPYINNYTVIAVRGDNPDHMFTEDELTGTYSFLRFSYLFPVFGLTSIGVEFDITDVETSEVRFFNNYSMA